jgi:hypothetical protein
MSRSEATSRRLLVILMGGMLLSLRSSRPPLLLQSHLSYSHFVATTLVGRLLGGGVMTVDAPQRQTSAKAPGMDMFMLYISHDGS